MAATTTSGFDIHGVAGAKPALFTKKSRCRFITPAAGHALELLGHAIEYLTDELVHRGMTVSAHDPQVEAIQLLMALNRQVYYECPVIPTFSERLRAFFHSHHKRARQRG